MTTADTAVELFKQSYSCSQSVFSAFAARFGIEPELAFRLSAGFGGGIGRTAQTCGCATGAVMAIGLTQEGVKPEENRVQKEKTYEKVRCLLREFAERNGSTRCLDLLGCDLGTPEGRDFAHKHELFKTRCAGFIRDAVEITERILKAD
jgi:C_GCAxxG_C_C family probable redox protein